LSVKKTLPSVNLSCRPQLNPQWISFSGQTAKIRSAPAGSKGRAIFVDAL
jgi:hypothetical protein